MIPNSAPRRSGTVARKKLRIALVAGNYNYIMDGAARSLNILVAHLLNRGHEVLVLAPTASEPAFQHTGNLFPIPSLQLPGRRGEYRLGLGLLPGTRAKLNGFRPHLIHIATPDLSGLTALQYAEKQDIPVVASFHTRFDKYASYYGAGWLEKHLTRYMRWLYGRCVHLYPPTRSMLEELRRDGIGRDLRLWRRGVDSEQFHPIRRDLAWRRSIGFRDDDVIVAFVGRLVIEKGLDRFSSALGLAMAANPRLRALVIGNGPESDWLKSRLPGGVFLGHQAGEDLARAYASADIFFNPSETETAGNVTLEAMASGICCLAADAPGSRSYVTDAETGLLVPAGAPAEDYAASLQLLAGNPDLRIRMGAAGRARVTANHRWEPILDEVVEHYYEALETFHGAPWRPVDGMTDKEDNPRIGAMKAV